MDGAIPIRGAASLIQATAAVSSTASPVADLRWVGTRLQRPIAYGDASSRLVSASSATKTVAVDGAAGDASTAAQQASVSVVVNMLAGWQKKNAQ